MTSVRTTADEASREELIASHLPLVRRIARRYLGRGEELDDLVQIGAIGLVKASDRFDPRRRVAFAAFATPVIEGEIRNHLRDRTPAVRIPREQEQARHELRHRRDELTSALAREPTVSELAVSLGVEEADIERALSAERARSSAPISAADDAPAQPRDQVTVDDSDDRLVLASSLQSLDERERRIVFLRFHADMTERDIGRELGISQAHVSRLLTAALDKLRQELARQGVEGGTAGDTTPQGDAPGTRISPVGEPEDRGSLTGQAPAGSKAAHTYSGRFLVRMPGSLHEQLAQAAEREQVSLNRLVTNLLSAAVSEGKAGERSNSPAEDASSGQRVSPRAVRLALATNLVVVVVAGVVAIVLLVLALQRGI